MATQTPSLSSPFCHTVFFYNSLCVDPFSLLAPLTRSRVQLDTAQAGIRVETTIQCSFSSHTRGRKKRKARHPFCGPKKKKKKKGEAQSCPCETISARAVNKLHHHRPTGRKRLVKHLHRRLHMVRGHECWSLAALSTLLHTRQCSFTGCAPCQREEYTMYTVHTHGEGGSPRPPLPGGCWKGAASLGR